MNSTIHDQAWLTWGANLETRIRQLEKHIHYPHSEVAMKEAAAKAQALSKEQAGWKEYKSQQATCGNSRGPLKTYEIISEAYPPPMRADTEAILTLTKFAKRLLNPDDLGHAVTFEVRQLARRALGLPEVKEYDL
jgi:hypothetical protein